MLATSRQLQCQSTPEFKTSVVRCLLQDLELQPCERSDLPFFYDRRIVQTLNTNSAFYYSSSPSSAATPILAYIDITTVKSWRKDSIVISRSKQFNSLLARLRQKAVQRLRPTKEWKDPYIAAVLIALAQGQRYALQQEEEPPTASKVRGSEGKAIDEFLMSSSTCRPPTPTSETTGSTAPPQPEYCKVHLLAIFAQCLRLYTARISWAYLDRFNMPSQHFASDPVLITYCRIPINQPARIIDELNCVIPRRFSSCDAQSPSFTTTTCEGAAEAHQPDARP